MTEPFLYVGVVARGNASLQSFLFPKALSWNVVVSFLLHSGDSPFFACPNTASATGKPSTEIFTFSMIFKKFIFEFHIVKM